MPSSPQLILATDLDGTFIPLDGHPQNQVDLQTLETEFRRHNVVLTFVTGRHLESVKHAILTHQLPQPDWVICDVGTSIYHRREQGKLQPVSEYADVLQQRVGGLSVTELQQQLAHISLLTLQEPEKQGRFKLSYYVSRPQLAEAVAAVENVLQQQQARYSLIDSVDPFTDDGLIDLLPQGVSKAFALDWWTHFTGHPRKSVVFSGDSGNDLAAFTAGYRAIIVGNADRQVAQQALRAHERARWQNRLFLADAPATSGVLEGCRHFGLIDGDDDT